MDAGVESPLDVLSRAATMVQESQQQEDAAVGKSAKQLPTTKWKRDRRTRPDYMRKSDPKIAPDSHESNGANGMDKSSSASSTSSSASMSPLSTSPNSNKMKRMNGGEKLGDAPLDMTTTPRQRGLPPSYSQAISDPSFRSTYTNSRSITNGRDDLPTGISMCDPIIDEHFRRSLGKDYNTVFNNNAKENPLKQSKPPIVLPPIAPSEAVAITPTVELPKTKSPSSPRPSPPVTSVIEMMDASGMSVDDHFAKALGDTWHKLNKKDSNHAEANGVATVTPPTEVVST